MRDVFHPDWKALPYWWEAAPLAPAEAALPQRADVVVVGAGYAGLSAALTLARAGVDVAVLDAGDPGSGASSRNHGMISGGQKLPADLVRRVGSEAARRIEEDARASFDYVENLIRQETLDADFARDGRFVAAHTRAAYAKLEIRARHLRDGFGYETRMVPAEEQRTEIGTDLYRGGMLLLDAGGLHPAKMHRALRRRAEESGARLFGHAAVRTTARTATGGFRVTTARGEIVADMVVFATNGYSDRAADYMRRRVIPVYAYIGATEELSPDLARSCIPNNRMVVDTKRVLFSARLSPDGTRMIFAGRVKFGDVDERTATPILHGFMLQVFPQLREARMTHTWKGFVAFTFDFLPHIAEHDGLHYVGGCQGNGVAMMPYLGHRLALKLLGRDNRQSGFDRAAFPTLPAYAGKPWFLPAVGALYKARDRLERFLDAR